VTAAPTIVPHDYQVAAVDSVLTTETTINPLVSMATGTGKSVVIGELCRRNIAADPACRILVLAPQQELIAQNERAMYGVCLGRRMLVPKAAFERLPRAMVEQFRKSGLGISGEVQARLWRTRE
jgi:ERCC4-related helicase